MENIGDQVKGTIDSAASSLQSNVRLAYSLCCSHPHFAFQSEKSSTQQMGDAVSGNSNENQVRNLQPPTGPSNVTQDSLMSKTKRALGLDSEN